PSPPIYFDFILSSYVAHLDLHSFPTRRSSDLHAGDRAEVLVLAALDLVLGDSDRAEARLVRIDEAHLALAGAYLLQLEATIVVGDRKSTRLNSSHVKISYAVFCLKKKKIRLHN